MHSESFKRIGLTGGIGSGKTTLGRMLVARGFALIDADAISRELTGVDGPAIPLIRKSFGDSFIAADGSMDRIQMRTLVFSQSQSKIQLESILHPLIRKAISDKEAIFKTEGKPLVILDIPLLLETDRWQEQFDGIIVVDSSPERQIARVMARNGWTQKEAQAVIDAQVSREQRLAVASWVINNDFDDLAALQKQADAWTPY
jgi:dephospho-CoA kinase